MASSQTTVTNRGDASKAQAGEKTPPASASEANAATAATSGGFKQYLPIIANIILMPTLAYAMTSFVLVPKLAKGAGSEAASSAAKSESHDNADAGNSHGSAAETKEASGGKAKFSVPLTKKTLVNVSGTMGTRYLLAEFVLVGTNPNFKASVERADAELRDAAAGALSAKTISDLEKPGIRNLIRSELINVFNTILGKGAVTEIYMTEFAIQ